MQSVLSKCGAGRSAAVAASKALLQKYTAPAINQSAVPFWSGAKTDWKKAVSEAEKIVGYPTSFMSLRCLLSDEISNVAMHMRKLVGTKHPLLKTARGFVYDGKHSLQARGLIILLLSKAAGPGPQSDSEDLDSMVSGILPDQRTLAEIIEMIYTANLIHKGVVNLDTLIPSDGARHDMEFGNKMAVLSGDFLLGSASTGLASLQNTYVVELISQAIGDVMKAEFTKLKDNDGYPSLSPDGATMEDWEEMTYLSSGSLLAKGCKSAMMLANQNDVIQDQAFTYGKHIAFAHQLNEDLQSYLHPSDDNGKMCALSAPAIYYVQQLGLKGRPLVELMSDSQQFYDRVRWSSAIQKMKTCCNDHGQSALDAIKEWKPSEAKSALQNIVKAVTTV